MVGAVSELYPLDEVTLGVGVACLAAARFRPKPEYPFRGRAGMTDGELRGRGLDPDPEPEPLFSEELRGKILFLGEYSPVHPG